MSLKAIEIARKWGEKGEKLKRVYHLIRDRDLFLAAYGKLYANKGATTPGTDPNDTVDGMSLRRIDDIIKRLEEGTYQWKPVKRVYIKKRNGKLRPLGLPGWNDKLLQEVIRMVLEAYYEPQFSRYSHGFRPGRGCHTALDEIHKRWKGIKWFIEGDIKGCFDNIDHRVLLNLIRRQIPDERFLQLLKDMLKTGYMEDFRYHETYSGTPQGGVISPILSNIILNELDQFVSNELIPKYSLGKKRKRNSEYDAISYQMVKAKKAQDIERYKELAKKRRQIPSVKTDDDEFSRLYYIRYADDFLGGVAGPLSTALAIKEEIGEFLQSIKLPMSDEKTFITHAATEEARFLGYELGVRRNDTKVTKDRNGKRKRRSVNNTIQLYVPRDVAQKWLNRYQKDGKPRSRAEQLNNSDYEIVMSYNLEFQGLVNYYCLAVDVSKRLQPVKYVYMQSLVRTLAHKHKKSCSWVYRQYLTKFETGVTGIMVTVPREEPKKPLIAKFGAKPIRRIKTAVLIDSKPKIVNTGRNELVRRLLAEKCELCGSTENIEVHHIRKISDLKKRYKGRKNPPKWVVFMIERNRKSIVVCRSCHRKIDSGNYDGRKLT